MAQRPNENVGTSSGGKICRRCVGKGYTVKQTSSGNQRVVCGACGGSGKGGYQTK